MTYTMTISEQVTAQKLQTYLDTDLHLSKKIRHQLRMTNGVAVNGEPANFHVTVKGGDTLAFTLSEAEFPPPTIRLGDAALVSVLFEDDHLIIVNKPVGMKTHPNDSEEEVTLLNHLAAYLAPAGQHPFVVHRLDQETSGAMLFAKNPLILPVLDRLLAGKDIKREYQAIIDGRLPRDTMTVTEAIGRDRHDNRKRIVTKKGGQSAVTHFTTDHKDAQHSYLYCQLETGRTHQIRVHLESLSHPVVGDQLYHPQGNKSERLMLHSHHISFIHPFTQEQLAFAATPGLWED